MTIKCAPWDHIYTWCYRINWPWGVLLPKVRRCIWCNHKPKRGQPV